MSRIVTFYSYKGGVGRTFALANIGVLLASYGKRVLLIDWDLEAPALDRYFPRNLTSPPLQNCGIIHLLHEAAIAPNADWRTHVQDVRVHTRNVSPEREYTLSLIPSGAPAQDYTDKVLSFSWERFYAEGNGSSILERWRSEWAKRYDFVLIDCRTGISDPVSLCTVQLPDFLVLVFTANSQSFEGVLTIADRFRVARSKLNVLRPPLTILPLLSRVDRKEDVSGLESWLSSCASQLHSFYADWLPKQFEPRLMLEVTKIPYIASLSCGEPLPAISHSLTDPELPGHYLDNAARILASDFQSAAQVVIPRDPKLRAPKAQIRALLQRTPLTHIELYQLFRTAARTLLLKKRDKDEFDVFLCHHSEDKPAVKIIGEQLKSQGVLPWLDDWELRAGVRWRPILERRIEHIKSAAVFLGSSGVGPWQDLEIDGILQQLVSRRCPIIPVLLPGASVSDQVPAFLRGVKWVDFSNLNADPFKNLIEAIIGSSYNEWDDWDSIL